MAGTETNIFAFLNLDELSSRYRLYRIKGLNHNNGSAADESYRKENSLIQRLSYKLQSPVTTIKEGDDTFLVVQEGSAKVPDSIEVVRSRVFLEPIDKVFDLDYTQRDPNNDRICLRFLQFLLREPLNRDKRLWSPAPGRPFYHNVPADTREGIQKLRGFRPRVISTPDGGIGICVDVAHKYVSEYPAPPRLTRRDFKGLDRRHFIYRFGHDWFEIRADFLDDLNISESTVDTDDGLISTLEFIYKHTDKPFPDELIKLPTDGSAMGYRNNRGEVRRAPSGLAYLVYGPHDRIMKKLHRHSILEPAERRRLIRQFVADHLSKLEFGNTRLQIANKPLDAPSRKFFVPDYEYGDGHVLSVRGTDGAQHVSLDNLGEIRLSLLQNGPGFYNRKPLKQHYFFMPYSVHLSYGEKLIADLTQVTDRLFPQENGYSPKLVLYEDRGEKIWPVQAAEIKKAAMANCAEPGYAVVMIHNSENRRTREEDVLAAAVVKELRELDFYASVIHTPYTRECYVVKRGSDGRPNCEVARGMGTKLRDYLQGVALNKVLLNDFRVPFNLATPLHADLTIGIDVKSHTAGFVIVGKRGGNIRFETDPDHADKEKISFKRMKRWAKEILRDEAEEADDPITHIVWHRDGKFHQSEREGILEAYAELKKAGILADDSTVTLLEIHKSSQNPFRLFEVSQRQDEPDQVWNPQVGYYYMCGGTDAYVCSTGRAFWKRRKGTVQPLHVRFLVGGLAFEKCLEDIYFLTCLAWTNPRDCSRVPITTKLNDRILG
ncbi:MAG: Piwi domain-containing protein, partial [Pyrinomonadaceae bacterium]